MDTLTSGDARNVAHLRNEDRFTFVEGDVRDEFERTLEETPVENEDVNRVYHLTSRASPADFEEYALDIAWTSAEGTSPVGRGPPTTRASASQKPRNRV